MGKIIMNNIKLYNGDCLEGMDKLIKEGVKVDLTVTSPPYDNLRNYNDTLNWNENIWRQVIETLFLITKEGGIVVWRVGDATVKGSETGTSFKQALYFKEIGFRLHDTMFYIKNSYPFPPSNRYYQQVEYMFIFSKGKPKYTNILRQPTKEHNRVKNKKGHTRNRDGSVSKLKYETGKDTRKMDNYWILETGYMKTSKDKESFKHPATYPEELAKRHILSWSKEYEIVFDPFMGSGTTGKMAILNNRKFIGMELDKGYYEIAKKRIKEAIDNKNKI